MIVLVCFALFLAALVVGDRLLDRFDVARAAWLARELDQGDEDDAA